MDQFDIGKEHVTPTGKRYIFLFVMMHSRTIVEVTTCHKHEALHALRSAIAFTGITPKRLRSDNGGEFESKEFTDYCNSFKIPIFREWSNPYNQHQNGVAESAVNKVSSKMRALLLQSG